MDELHKSLQDELDELGSHARVIMLAIIRRREMVEKLTGMTSPEHYKDGKALYTEYREMFEVYEESDDYYDPDNETEIFWVLESYLNDLYEYKRIHDQWGAE